MAVGVVGSENRKAVLLRSAIFCLIALVMYLPPLLSLLSDFQFYSNSLSGLSTNGGGFGNSGPISVLQGMGKWSLSDYNWRVPHYKADLALWRQLIRAIPASLVFLAFLSITIMKPEVKFLRNTRVFMVFLPVFAIMISASNFPLVVWAIGVLVLAGTSQFYPNRVSGKMGKSLGQELHVFLLLSVLCLVFYSLSLIGHYNWYWVLRQNFTLLTMFREPWAKFSILYVFFLCIAFAALVETLKALVVFATGKRIVRNLKVALLVSVALIAVPMFSNKPVEQINNGLRIEFASPKLNNWRAAHNQITENEILLSSSTICILNLDPTNSIQTLFRIGFPNNSRLSSLVTGYPKMGKDCSRDSLSLKVITLPGEGPQIGNSYEVRTGTNWCIYKELSNFMLIDKECGVQFEKSAISRYRLTINPYDSKGIVPR
jgi:hypothetical protein